MIAVIIIFCNYSENNYFRKISKYYHNRIEYYRKREKNRIKDEYKVDTIMIAKKRYSKSQRGYNIK